MQRYSVKNRLYIFIILTILLVALSTTIVSYVINSNQVDSFYKISASDNAKNFTMMVDPEFMKALKKCIVSDEYQALRIRAEEDNDDSLIQSYLEDKGLWEQCSDMRDKIDTYLDNVSSIKYLYIVAYEGKDAEYDMYLADDGTTALSEIGYYEKREADLEGVDLITAEPVISNGDWGWLCSSYSPVYDSDGEFVCLVGCDISMDTVMSERHMYLMYIVVITLVIILVVFIGAFMILNKTLIRPLTGIANAVRDFVPSKNRAEANIISMNINGKNEIGEIYKAIQSMENSIIDYLNDMSAMKDDIIRKNNEISKLSTTSYKDVLTNVGNKTAYTSAKSKLNKQIAMGTNIDFSVVMIDINNLKEVNDECGHKSGDDYIVGCCRMICETFKHSPVYRVGGDEFVVITQGYDYQRRYELCELLMSSFDESYNNTDAKRYSRYSASIGMADYKQGDSTVDAVFKRADKMMYENKEKFKSVHGRYR